MKYPALGFMITKPVIDNFVFFSPDRVPIIRENRIENLAKGLITREKKKTKRKSTSKRKPKVITLNAKAQQSMSGMDDATKDFLANALKGL